MYVKPAAGAFIIFLVYGQIIRLPVNVCYHKITVITCISLVCMSCSVVTNVVTNPQVLFLMFVEHRGLFLRHKLQSGKRADPSLVREALKHTLISHLISVPLAIYYGFGFFRSRGMVMSLAFEDLPTFSHTVITLLWWHVLFDTWFYWGHRAHHEFPLLYRMVHKQHHRFTTPIGLAAVYAHPVEDVLVNLGSTFVGPVLFPDHLVIWLIYIALRFHETVDAHSGYDLPWSPWRYLGWMHGGAGRHDWHHSHQLGNYGGFWFWDWICGTDKHWKAWKKKQLKRG